MDAIHLEAWAAAVVNGDGTVQNAKGLTVGVAANVYTLTLDKALDAAECIADVTVIGTDGTRAMFHMFNNVSDTEKTVRFFYTSGGAAQATNFMVQIRQLLPAG